jgi:hypothetical protein
MSLRERLVKKLLVKKLEDRQEILKKLQNKYDNKRGMKSYKVNTELGKYKPPNVLKLPDKEDKRLLDKIDKLKKECTEIQKSINRLNDLP